MTAATRPEDAASLLLLRDAPEGPQVYMVKRHPRNRFLANALVFVGGRRDEADSSSELAARCVGLDDATLRARLDLEDADRARGLYVAAIRECFEESGILLARCEEQLPEDLSELRARLNSRDISFEQMLGDTGLVLALDRLRYLDRWVTPEFEHRRFDTHFFACRCPEGQQASADPRETSFGGWFAITNVLQENHINRARLFPPTLVILEDLSSHTTVEQILEASPDRPRQPIMPRPLMERSEHPTLLLPGDHRYDDPGSASGPEHYVVLREEHWERIRRG